MQSPFDPITIAGAEIRNRFVRSATWDASATDDGRVTDTSVQIVEGLAGGGVGLIMTGYAYVSDIGRAAIGQYGVAEDKHIPGLKRLVEAAHANGARIGAQIAHAGSNMLLLGRNDRVALCPSAGDNPRQPQRSMTDEEIGQTIADFAAGALRACEAGFDAVQLHFAHGYLGSQFLSPLSNHRTDAWGGTPERRRRFHVETVRAVRRAVGEGFPVWAKFGLVESEGGLTLEEGLETLKAMIAEGLSAVEISVGIGSSTRPALPDDPEAPYFLTEAAAAKKAGGIPTIVVGGFRKIETVEGLISSGQVDMISMSRPLIREPGLIKRWEGGDRAQAKCIRCNKCLAAIFAQRDFQCQQEKLLREEAAEAI
jgi:2,4-dienoyl-CoA reductase-like NADH-dependent reductase (Old Yellow Enzyme family)